jgi:hypothetical protein
MNMFAKYTAPTPDTTKIGPIGVVVVPNHCSDANVECAATLPMLLCHMAAMLFATTPEALNPNRDGIVSAVPIPIALTPAAPVAVASKPIGFVLHTGPQATPPAYEFMSCAATAGPIKSPVAVTPV